MNFNHILKFEILGVTVGTTLCPPRRSWRWHSWSQAKAGWSSPPQGYAAPFSHRRDATMGRGSFKTYSSLPWMARNSPSLGGLLQGFAPPQARCSGERWLNSQGPVLGVNRRHHLIPVVTTPSSSCGASSLPATVRTCPRHPSSELVHAVEFVLVVSSHDIFPRIASHDPKLLCYWREVILGDFILSCDFVLCHVHDR
jgi:hypothetical protein